MLLVTLVVLKKTGMLKPEWITALREKAGLSSGVATDANQQTPQWEGEARRLLQAFLSAPTNSRRVPLVLQTPGVADRMQSFYSSTEGTFSPLPVSSYAVIPLSEADESRGLHLMGSDLTEPDGRRLVSRIFFREAEDGMRLDWDVYAQSQFRFFERFLAVDTDGPKPLSQILRAEITQVPTADAADRGKGMVTYRVNDPFYREQSITVKMSQDSPVANYLAEINWINVPGAVEPQMGKLCTIELDRVRRGGQEVVELRRFICWEFFGLGNPTNVSVVNPAP